MDEDVLGAGATLLGCDQLSWEQRISAPGAIHRHKVPKLNLHLHTRVYQKKLKMNRRQLRADNEHAKLVTPVLIGPHSSNIRTQLPPKPSAHPSDIEIPPILIKHLSSFPLLSLLPHPSSQSLVPFVSFPPPPFFLTYLTFTQTTIRPRHRARPFPMPVVTSNDRGLAAMATLQLSLLSSPRHVSHRRHSSSLPCLQTSHSALPLPSYHNFGSNMLCFMQMYHAPPFRYQTCRLSSLHRHKSRFIAVLHMRRMRSLSRLFLHPIYGRLCRLLHHSSPYCATRPRHQVAPFTTRCYQTDASFTSPENIMVTSHARTTHDRCTFLADIQVGSKECRQIAFAPSAGGRCAATAGRTSRPPTTWRRNNWASCTRADNDFDLPAGQFGVYYSSRKAVSREWTRSQGLNI